MNDEPKSTEEQVEKIEAIDGAGTLGYEGAGREEHSGENSPRTPNTLGERLADNRQKDR